MAATGYTTGISNIESIQKLTAELTSLNIALKDTVSLMGQIATTKIPNLGGLGGVSNKVKLGVAFNDTDLEKIRTDFNSLINDKDNKNLVSYTSNLATLQKQLNSLGNITPQASKLFSAINSELNKASNQLLSGLPNISGGGSGSKDPLKDYRNQFSLLTNQFKNNRDINVYTSEVNKLISSMGSLGKQTTQSSNLIEQMKFKLKQASAGTGEFDFSMDKMSHKLRSFNILMGTAFSIHKLEQFIGLSVQEFAKLELGVANVLTLLSDADAKQYGSSFTLGIRRMALETGKPIEELAKGLYDINSSGIKASESMQVLELATKAALAGQTSIQTATRVGVATMNAYGLSVKDLSTIFDKQFASVKVGIYTYEEFSNALQYVQASAKNAGVSLDDLYSTMAFLTRAGLNAERAAIGLQHVFDRLVTNVDKFSQFANIFDDISGKIKPLPELFKQLSENLNKLPMVTRLKEIRDLVPDVRGMRVFMILLDGWSNYKKTVDEYHQSIVNANEEAFKRIENTTSMALKRMEQQWNDLKVSIGESAPVSWVTWYINAIFEVDIKKITMKTQETIEGMKQQAFNEFLATNKKQIQQWVVSDARIAVELDRNNPFKIIPAGVPEGMDAMKTWFNNIYSFFSGSKAESLKTYSERLDEIMERLDRGTISAKDLSYVLELLGRGGNKDFMKDTQKNAQQIIDNVNKFSEAYKIMLEMPRKYQDKFKISLDSGKTQLDYQKSLEALLRATGEERMKIADAIIVRIGEQQKLINNIHDTEMAILNIEDSINRTRDNSTKKIREWADLLLESGKISPKQYQDMIKDAQNLDSVLTKLNKDIENNPMFSGIKNKSLEEQDRLGLIRQKMQLEALKKAEDMSRGLLTVQKETDLEQLKNQATLQQALEKGYKKEYDDYLKIKKEWMDADAGLDQMSYLQKIDYLEKQKKAFVFSQNPEAVKAINQEILKVVLDMKKKETQLIIEEKKRQARLELDIERDKLNSQLNAQKDFLNNLKGIFTKGMPSWEEMMMMKPQDLTKYLESIRKMNDAMIKQMGGTMGIAQKQQIIGQFYGGAGIGSQELYKNIFKQTEGYYSTLPNGMKGEWIPPTQAMQPYLDNMAKFNDISYVGVDTLQQLVQLEDRLNITRNESLRNIEEVIKRYGTLNNLFNVLIQHNTEYNQHQAING